MPSVEKILAFMKEQDLVTFTVCSRRRTEQQPGEKKHRKKQKHLQNTNAQVRKDQSSVVLSKDRLGKCIPEKNEQCAPDFSQKIVTSKNDVSIKHDIKEKKCLSDLTKVFECTVCSKWFSRKILLDLHLEELHRDRDLHFTCKVNSCGSKFSSNKGLLSHISQKHNGFDPTRITPYQYKCDICHKQFRIKKYLQQHVKTVHTPFDPSDLFECEVCGKLSKTWQDIERHRALHRELRPYQCMKIGCDKVFKTADGLKSHIRACHSPHLRDQYSCVVCGSGFPSLQALHKHSFACLKEAPFSCPCCLHRFSQNSYYRVHYKRVHMKPDQTDFSKIPKSRVNAYTVQRCYQTCLPLKYRGNF